MYASDVIAPEPGTTRAKSEMNAGTGFGAGCTVGDAVGAVVTGAADDDAERTTIAAPQIAVTMQIRDDGCMCSSV